ncbi:MAG: hypothetical protein IJY18_03190 [Clostridia bacterium]|nr:hypothetical protein [Clostridia bacterium]
MKIYNSPEISIEIMDNSDIITTSDITLGTTTSTVESQGGSWEVIG